MSTIKILLADDHRLMLDGMRSVLQAEKDFSVVATAVNGREVLQRVEEHAVDICLLDIQMPGMDGIETIVRLKESHPFVKIIVVSTYSDKEIVFKIVRMGVAGYMLKNSSKEELATAIRKVAAGGMYLSAEIEKIIIAGESSAMPVKEVTLTPRETDIVRLLAQEFTNEQIAAQLHISYRTVETHRKNIMQKTECKNLAGLMKFAAGRGII